MILSQTAVYALQATLLLAETRSEGPVRVDDIAQRLDVPRNYLSKILHVLARKGVLASTRGPGGGFRLASQPEEVMLSTVVEHFDHLPGESGCLLGREECSDADPCAAHAHWKVISVAVRQFFDQTSVADLSADGPLAEAKSTV